MVLRPVASEDAMTADWARLPAEVLARISTRITNEVPEVNRVDRTGRHVLVTGTGELVNAVVITLHAAGVTARDVQLDSSNLEDAFVRLTGRQLAHTNEGASS